MIFAAVVINETVLYLPSEYTWNAISAIQPVQQYDLSKHQEQEQHKKRVSTHIFQWLSHFFCTQNLIILFWFQFS